MPQIEHTQEGSFVQKIALNEGEVRLGRRRDNDICLDDHSVSGHHAALIIVPDNYFQGQMVCTVKDLGSTNGTLVNGRIIKATYRLTHHDVIQIGLQAFKFIDDNRDDYDTTRILLREDVGL